MSELRKAILAQRAANRRNAEILRADKALRPDTSYRYREVSAGTWGTK